ncbi:MAG: serine/threonine-protein kinase [Planctomycetota bacterium]
MSDFDNKVDEVFARAIELQSEERARYLDEACAGDDRLRREVEELIEADERMPTGFLDGAEAADEPGMPSSIGRYRILREIGRGGMGVVYEAEQESPRRRVAVKLIRDSFATEEIRRRFENEANALGRLEHPGIARIYEAGAAQLERQVCPFFAMEYIDGPPIDRFVRQEALGRAEIADLMARVCDAVQHAHERGIVHRDLKPANILVEKVGTTTTARQSSQTARPTNPKVLDFGVARFVDPDARAITVQTGASQLVGTIAYMSPEQLEGDSKLIDERTDVYALGVMLFELLAGRPPIDLSGVPIAEAARLVRDTPPRSLSTIDKSLRGDLDTIVAAAMEHDRDRRYASAASLAEDLRRYLASEPIAARPPSTLYQLSKFASRNKALVGGVAASFALLTAGVIGTSIGLASALEANRSLTAANQELEELNETLGERNDELEVISGFQAAQLTRIDPEAMGAALRRSLLDEVTDEDRDGFESSLGRMNLTNVAMELIEAEVIDKSAEAIGIEFADRPRYSSRLHHAMAETMRALGFFERAQAQADRAYEQRRVLYGEDDRLTLETRHIQAIVRGSLDDAEGAEAAYEALESAYERLDGPESADALAIKSQRGHLIAGRGDVELGLELMQAAAGGLVESAGTDDQSTLAAQGRLAETLAGVGRNEEAIALFEEVLETERRVLDDNHPSTIATLSTLASILGEAGETARAVELMGEVVQTRRRTLGDRHPDTLRSILNLAILNYYAGRPEEALAFAREQYEGTLEVFGSYSLTTADAAQTFALVANETGASAEVVPLLLEVLRIREETLGGDHPLVIIAVGNLAAIYGRQGRYEEAEPLYVRSYETAEAVFGPDHPEALRTKSEYARFLSLDERYDESEPLVIEVYEQRRALVGDDHPETIQARFDLAALFEVRERYEEGEGHAVEVLAAFQQLRGEDHFQTIRTHTLLGFLREGLGKYEEAAESFRTAVESATRNFGPDNPLAVRPRNGLERVEAAMQSAPEDG